MTKTTTCLTTIFCFFLATGCGERDSAGTAEDAGGPGAIDLIVEGDYVVTMDPGRRIVTDGAIAIHDGVILAVASAREIRSVKCFAWISVRKPKRH
jgi:hypothetical protein